MPSARLLGYCAIHSTRLSLRKTHVHDRCHTPVRCDYSQLVGKNSLRMPKRTPRGIFGLPSRNMLFSFTPRVGDEWPDEEEYDDGDDSDYEPGNDLKPMVEDIPRTSDSDSSEMAMEGTSRKRKRKSKTPKSSKKTKREKPKKSKSPSSRKDKVKRKKDRRKESKHRGTSGGEASGKKTATNKRVVESKRDPTAVGEGDDMWGQRLPLIALEKILFYAVCQTGVVPLLCRASRVCRLWREAAELPSLWHHVALDNGRLKATDATLEWLIANRLPSQLKSINLNSWTKLTDKSFVALTEACSDIQNISVQKCAKLTSRSMNAIKDHCPNLKQLDLGFTGSSLASSPSVRDLLKERGGTLQELQLPGCLIISSGNLMNSIKAFCGDLRLLDLSNCQVTTECLTLPVEEMQRGCPNLEILRLAGTRVQASTASAKAQRESSGFSKLIELSVAVADNVAWQVVLPTNQGIGDDFLRRVLKNSPCLKLLDLRGCSLIRMQTLQDLNADCLEHLHISRCSLSKYEGLDVMIAKWSHSLIELDLSWITCSQSCLDKVMKNLSSGHQLRTLDLSGTSVSISGVRLILKGCTALECIKLTSCRSLPRGYKRCYEGKHLRKLLKELQNVQDVNEDD